MPATAGRGPQEVAQMNDALEREIRRRLERIRELTREVSVAFGADPGLVETRGFDRKCSEVVVHADWIGDHLDDEGDDWTATGSFPIVNLDESDVVD